MGPEHSYLKDSGQVTYDVVDDEEAMAAFDLMCSKEGIIPALESSHAVAWAIREAPKMDKNQVILVNLSGRGDKDINTVATLRNIVIE